MMINRRIFSKLAAASLGTIPMASSAVASTAIKSPLSLRVIAYNVFGGKGWPHNRRLSMEAVRQGQMAQRFAENLAIYHPDVITLSESPDEAMTQRLAELLQMHHVRFPSSGKWPGTLLSRFEILDSTTTPRLRSNLTPGLFTRHWGRATLKLSDHSNLVIHSAHLMPGDAVETRLQEIAEMSEAMTADLASGQSMLLMGDLNHGPDSREYGQWRASGWVDTFASAGEGNGYTSRSDIPRYRIDYVLAHGPIAERVVVSKPLFEGAFRLHIADKEAFALSDHLPQFAEFQLSPTTG